MSTHEKNSNTHIELASLYQEVILEHFKRPRFKGKTEHCQFCLEGKNPLCGDTVTVFCEVKHVDNCELLNLHFEGSGCSISQASASMMCDALQGVELKMAQKILKHAEGIYTGQHKQDASDLESDLDALYGVSKFPVRIKCAALPWKTLEILLTENFDADGKAKPGCNKLTNCVLNQTKKLKIVST